MEAIKLHKRHVVVSVDGLESRLNAGLETFITHDDGRPMTVYEQCQLIAEHRKLGHEVIPMGKCDNYDDRGHCKGHPIEQSDIKKKGSYRKLVRHLRRQKEAENAKASRT